MKKEGEKSPKRQRIAMKIRGVKRNSNKRKKLSGKGGRLLHRHGLDK